MQPAGNPDRDATPHPARGKKRMLPQPPAPPLTPAIIESLRKKKKVRVPVRMRLRARMCLQHQHVVSYMLSCIFLSVFSVALPTQPFVKSSRT